MDKFKKIVFSDVDGTLVKDYITVDFIRWLHKNHRNLINENAFKEHENLLKMHDEKKISYMTLVFKWSQNVAKCLSGKEVKKIESKAKTFFKIFKKKKIYPSTFSLVKLMKKKGYLFILVSGGLDYLTGLFAKEVGADDFIGMKIKTKNGIYSEFLENDVRTKKGKDKEIKKFFKKYNSNKKFAIGLGDSPQDAAIFKNTKKIVALNPNSELKKLALEKQWFIAKHKNIIRIMNNCFNSGKIKSD